MAFSLKVLFFLIILVTIISNQIVFVNAQTSFLSISSPVQQIKDGVSIEKIICLDRLVLIKKLSENSPACVKPSTAQKLLDQNWSLVETPKSDNMVIGIISTNVTSIQNYPQAPDVHISNQTLAHLPTIKKAMHSADILGYYPPYNTTINDNEARLALGILDFQVMKTSTQSGFLKHFTNIEYYGKYYWIVIVFS
jgi:hypothetical protein